MWTPQIIFCVATQCWLASATPMPDEQACHEHVRMKMIPAVLLTMPSSYIRAARCHNPDTPA